MEPVSAQKYRLYHVVSYVLLLVTIVCLCLMSPWAEPHYNKVMFAWAMVCILIGLVSAIAAVYFGAKARSLRVDPTPVRTLGNYGKQLKQPQKRPK